MSVIDALSLGFLGIICASSLVSVFFLGNLYFSTQSAVRSIGTFVVARDDEPSHLALLWDSMVERAMGKVTMGQLGTKSGDARREKSADVDYIKGVVANEQPMIAALLDQFFPKWGKMLANNPQMMPQMLSFINKKSGESAEKVPTNGNQSTMKFPL